MSEELQKKPTMNTEQKKYIEIGENQEVFLWRTCNYTRNCSERLKNQITYPRVNLDELKTIADSLINMGQEIKKRFILK